MQSSNGDFACSLAVFAAPQTHRTKVQYAIVESAGKIVLDYVTRRFNASSAGLNKPVGLNLR
jgi:hypothetical protein